MPSSEKRPSALPMWNGIKVSYSLIAMCLFPLAIGGYWAYGQLVSFFNSLKLALLISAQNDMYANFVLY